MLSDKNKFLLVKKGVVLNAFLDGVVNKLDKFFEQANHIAYVTSGIRTAEEQLRIIKNFVKEKKIADEFIDSATVNSLVLWNGKQIYSWQLAWSKLLNIGVIVNPPLKAEVLLDYIHRSGENQKGFIKNPSVHFLGLAFDIGGGLNSVKDEETILDEAIKSKEMPEIVGTVVERENNCLHVDLKPSIYSSKV